MKILVTEVWLHLSAWSLSEKLSPAELEVYCWTTGEKEFRRKEIWWKHIAHNSTLDVKGTVLFRAQGQSDIHRPWWEGLGAWLRIGHKSWRPEVKPEHAAWCKRQPCDLPLMAHAPPLGTAASLNVFSVCFWLFGEAGYWAKPIPSAPRKRLALFSVPYSLLASF